MLKDAIEFIETGWSGKGKSHLVYWLKSIKNRIIWNPSEKQGEPKSVWHDDSDEPIRGSLILLIMQSGTPVVAKIIEPNHTFNHGERWAYIDDLIKL